MRQDSGATESLPTERAHLRTSSYVIYVDLPGHADDMLLVHGYTGAYDKVSRRVATFLRSLETRRPPRPLYGDWSPEPAVDGHVSPPSDKTIQTLKRRGYLTEMSLVEEEEFFDRVATRLHEKSLQWMPSYMVMPTYNCNLRCAYCFQDHMRTDPRYSHLLKVMRPEVVDKIFTAMVNIETMHGYTADSSPRREIGFFGGEPLLESSLPIVRYIIEEAQKRGPAGFWAITNGTDLAAYRDLLSPTRLARLQITIDGPKREHDKRRIYADGSGSYARIADNISMALDLGVIVHARLNIDRANIEDLPEVAQDFIDRGWDKYPNFASYAACIRAENENVDKKTVFNTWELDQALAKLATEHPQMKVISRPDGGINTQARRIFRDPDKAMPNFRESFCSAHTGLYIFDAFSDIYACWDRTGDPTIRIGHVEDDGNVTLNAPVNAMWRGRTVTTNPVCRRCRYALSCGGGCAVLAFSRSGDYYTSFCDGYASRFRARVAEAYLDHVRNAPDAQSVLSPCSDRPS